MRLPAPLHARTAYPESDSQQPGRSAVTVLLISQSQSPSSRRLVSPQDPSKAKERYSWMTPPLPVVDSGLTHAIATPLPLEANRTWLTRPTVNLIHRRVKCVTCERK